MRFKVHVAWLGGVPLLALPTEIVGLCGRLVLVHQVADDRPRFIQLGEVVLEHVLLPELIEEGAPLPQLVVLRQTALEQLQ